MGKRITVRTIKRKLRRLFTREGIFVALSFVMLMAVIIYGIMQSRIMINPAAYTPLLTVIAKGESRGNYNAYFGSVANRDIMFTNMSIGDVLAWQRSYVEQGSPSNAVGRYQIIQPTLEGLVTQLKLSSDTIFDEALQDKLAISLMEQRGSIDFIKGDISAQDYAHNLSKEWAALPRVIGKAPESSFYAGDGLNASLITSAAMLDAIEKFKDKAEENQS